MTTDEAIRDKFAELIQIQYGSANVQAGKTVVAREDETYPLVRVFCRYDGEDPGENTPDRRRNCFYTCVVVLYAKSDEANTGAETINEMRATIAGMFYGPTLAGVSVVEDIRTRSLPEWALMQIRPGTDTQALAFAVETFEP